MACKKNRIKCVLRIANHPRDSLVFFNNLINFKIKLLIKLFFYRFADGIICNSISSSKYLKSKIKNLNIASIYNPIKLSKHNSIIKKKKLYFNCW